jgi:transportin-3
VAADVDRLTAVMRYIVIDGGDVAGIFASLQPLLAQVLELFQNKSEYVCEKVCRCYKHSIRSCRAAFAPTLKQMTSHLAEQFQKNCIAAFLYAGAICVTDFSREGGGVYVSTLYEMLWSMSNTFFQRMSSLQQFEQKPDVVEEYFYLMAKALQNCPVPLLQSPQGAGALVQAGITGLQLKHKEAQKGILLFFERLIQLPSSVHLAADSLSALREEARTLVKQSGQALVSMVFASLAGQAPALALDENNGCSSDVMWGLHLQAPREMKVLCYLNIVWVC